MSKGRYDETFAGEDVGIVICNKKLNFVSRNWRMEISSVACGFSSIQIYHSDYPKSLISRINEVYLFFIKISLNTFAAKHLKKPIPQCQACFKDS